MADVNNQKVGRMLTKVQGEEAYKMIDDLTRVSIWNGNTFGQLN